MLGTSELVRASHGGCHCRKVRPRNRMQPSRLQQYGVDVGK